jgi:hypothetical protein
MVFQLKAARLSMLNHMNKSGISDRRSESINCKHEWRLFGTRLEEDAFPVPTEDSGSIVCTKCGIEQSAEGYEWVKERPVLEYSGSWAEFAKDIIVNPKKFGLTESTVSAYNSRTNTLYDEARFIWDNKEEPGPR